MKPDIGLKPRFLPTPPVFDALVREWGLGGPRRNIALRFGVKKTRMVWLPDGEKK